MSLLPDSPRRTPPTRTLVVGLGNILLRDDGVGVHAVRALRNVLPPRIVTAEVGTAVLDALHLYEWADRIIGIDAMQAGGAPGTIYSFGVDDVANADARASLHEIGFIAAVRLLKRPQPEICILAVEPETLDAGMDLSAPVEAALPELVRVAKALAESDPNWGRLSRSHTAD